jgi:PAS domain S-box-containing protein
MEATSLYETILRCMNDAVYLVDQDLSIRFANPAAEQLTGYSVDESIGRRCDEIFCERSSRCDSGCPLIKTIQTGVPYLHREAETKTKSGTVLRTQISVSPFFDGDRRIGTVLVIKDISELKAAEEKIILQNSFLTEVIDALPHPFYVIDAETYRVKLANRAAIPEAKPGDVTCYELSHLRNMPCEGSEHPCPMVLVKETGRPCTVEHAHHHPDGTVRDMEAHGFPIFDAKGNVIQMIEYCIDISDRKKAIEEREALIKDLQRALAEVKVLSGLLPICSSCKKIRDEAGSWNNLERYISKHSKAEFSHGLCPECAQKLYPKIYDKLKP